MGEATCNVLWRRLLKQVSAALFRVAEQASSGCRKRMLQVAQ